MLIYKVILICIKLWKIKTNKMLAFLDGLEMEMKAYVKVIEY